MKGKRGLKDKFRLDLTDKDTTFIWETLHGFSENAAKYRRKLIEMRMAKIMFDRLYQPE